MFDEMNHDPIQTNAGEERLPVADGAAGPAPEPVPAEVPAATPPAEANGVPVAAEGHTRYAEAGRKGAARVHQLIRLGRQYEEEHGLKRGRQRLRQLIEEGKLYEQEHGLRLARKPRKRLGRLGREQVLRTFLEAVARMVKPAYRQRLKEVLAALDNDSQ
jgi:hypothetical protein